MVDTSKFVKNLQVDWEDNDGLAPFQERYTKEYIRALSIGYQAGCLACVLGKISGKDGW